MGMVTEKDFVIANAVDNIMMQPKKPADHPAAATQRRTFGKPPGYLTRIKEEIEHEREYIRQLQHPPRGEGRMREMPPDEKQELLATHKQYLSQTFSLDTVSKVHRKEAIEAQLEQLEKAMAKLSKKILCVYESEYDDNMY
ncbi:hypothetical protein DIPPA_21952 [Diplonema papillatum]|nr:hypothetical protein DIPPA_21952 [Diplonema papillatum]